MYRRFIATIAAASIAITALGSFPAYAGEKEIARAAAAILGIAIIGKIIHDKNKRDDEREVTRRRPAPVVVPPHRPHPTVRPRPVHPRPLPSRVDRKLLPSQCFRSYDTRQGKVRMFGQRCLQENYRFADRLPNYCAETVRTERGVRRGYDARCLRDAGYRLARG